MYLIFYHITVLLTVSSTDQVGFSEHSLGFMLINNRVFNHLDDVYKNKNKMNLILLLSDKNKQEL